MGESQSVIKRPGGEAAARMGIWISTVFWCWRRRKSLIVLWFMSFAIENRWIIQTDSMQRCFGYSHIIGNGIGGWRRMAVSWCRDVYENRYYWQRSFLNVQRPDFRSSSQSITAGMHILRNMVVMPDSGLKNEPPGSTYAIVFFTTVIQGMTMKYVYQKIDKKISTL